MKTVFLFLSLLFLTNIEAAEFPLGPARKSWGIEIPHHQDGIPLTFKIGARLQAIAAQSYRHDVTTNKVEEFQDFYARRTRLQFKADYNNSMSFSMDLRDDNANLGDRGEGSFNIGDAAFEVKNAFGSENLLFRAFRTKVDVSRSQTASSANLLILDRAKVADEAAQFVNHNRRASNIQLLGIYDYFSFQAAIGDGVHKNSFSDAKGKTLSSGSIDSQRFMIGGKLRFYPIKEWEDNNITETYFGRGQHFSFGSGIFHTAEIEYQSSAQTDKVSRTLFNHELSFHYRNLSFQAEYFRFNGVIEDFSSSTKNIGTGDGYYAQVEYVLPEFLYFAPFARYESWDRFNKRSGYNLLSYTGGMNWYLKGNDLKMSLFYQFDKYEKNLQSTDSRGRTFDKDKQIKLATMMHF